MTQWQERVRGLPAFDVSKYGDLDLDRLIVFTIAELQDAQIPLTFESVVAAAYIHFPERFALVGFPEYPDAARAGRVLLHLRPKYRNWATGTVARGFVLTDAGKRVLDETKAILSGSAPAKAVRAKRPQPPSDQKRTRDVSDDLRDVVASPLFKEFLATGEVRVDRAGSIYELLGGFPYTPKRALLHRLEALRGTAVAIGREDVDDFLRLVRTQYGGVFADKGRG